MLCHTEVVSKPDANAELSPLVVRWWTAWRRPTPASSGRLRSLRSPRLNEVYGPEGGHSALEPDVRAIQSHSLEREKW